LSMPLVGTAVLTPVCRPREARRAP
ncbi:hypothetical protein A2U01_0078747, partial [Trifolium medium]|nr:hypothetical protein [Trifolium medium]